MLAAYSVSAKPKNGLWRAASAVVDPWARDLPHGAFVGAGLAPPVAHGRHASIRACAGAGAYSVGRFGLLAQADGARQDEEHGQRRDRSAHVKRRYQADLAPEHAAEHGPDRDGPPDDRAHGRVQASLEADGHDRLAQADLVDVVDAAGEEQDEERG